MDLVEVKATDDIAADEATVGAVESDIVDGADDDSRSAEGTLEAAVTV